MKKLLFILIFSFSFFTFHCFSQLQQGNMELPKKEKALMHSPNDFRNNPKIPQNQQLTTNSKKTLHAMSLQKSLKWQWDTIITYAPLPKDTLGQLYFRCTQTFDVYGNVLINKSELWQDTAWVNNGIDTYTNDANGNMLIDLGEYWDNNTWRNSCKFTYTYDANGNMLTLLFEEWQYTNWVNQCRDTYTYDTNGNRLTRLGQHWENNDWVNGAIDTYTYDAKGNMLSDLYEEWENKAWFNYDSTTYKYDANGKMLTALHEGWQNKTWMNDSMNSYTYDANGNRLTDLEEYLQDSVWVNGFRYTYTYDANGNMFTDLSELWQDTVWVNQWIYTYTYNANNNSITGKYENWDSTAWQPGMRTLDVYSQKTPIYGIYDIYRYQVLHWVSFTAGINQLTNSNEQLTVYPNPANSLLDVSYQLIENSAINISIYDIMGREVADIINESQGKGEHVIKINTQQFEDGIYIMKFSSMGFIGTKKIVVQH